MRYYVKWFMFWVLVIGVVELLTGKQHCWSASLDGVRHTVCVGGA